MRTACPDGLERAAARLETRALVSLGRRDEGALCWHRYVTSVTGERKWVK